MAVFRYDSILQQIQRPHLGITWRFRVSLTTCVSDCLEMETVSWCNFAFCKQSGKSLRFDSEYGS